MRIYVFSYNRGRFLRNCLNSILRHVPQYPITVIDDGSTDPEVSKVLKDFYERVTIVQSERKDKEQYLGGLYANMQYAIDNPSGEKWALFIQDDQQIVRNIDRADIDHWEQFFDAYPEALELATNFLKANRRAGSLRFKIDYEVPVYFRDSSVSRRTHFAATGLFHKERMRAVDWRFQVTEGWNEEMARNLGYKMGFSPYPFMMWLPNAESAKFQRKGFMHRFAEWYRGVGFYPYSDMTENEVAWLRGRDISELPLAQDILHPVGMRTDQLWLFEDATKSIRFIHRRLKRKKKRKAARMKS